MLSVCLCVRLVYQVEIWSSRVHESNSCKCACFSPYIYIVCVCICARVCMYMCVRECVRKEKKTRELIVI